MCKICVNCLRTDDCAECVFCKVSFFSLILLGFPNNCRVKCLYLYKAIRVIDLRDVNQLPFQVISWFTFCIVPLSWQYYISKVCLIHLIHVLLSCDLQITFLCLCMTMTIWWHIVSRHGQLKRSSILYFLERAMKILQTGQRCARTDCARRSQIL